MNFEGSKVETKGRNLKNTSRIVMVLVTIALVVAEFFLHSGPEKYFYAIILGVVTTLIGFAIEVFINTRERVEEVSLDTRNRVEEGSREIRNRVEQAMGKV